MSKDAKLHDNSIDYRFPPTVVETETGERHVLREAYLPTHIDEYEEIDSIIKLLRSPQSAGDIISLYCRGYGGCTMIGTEIINAINNSHANVITIASASCYSMHTIIALSQAKSLKIEPGVQFMFHESQIRLGGGIENVRRDLAAIIREDKHLDKYVKKFLTKAEYKDMIEGRNVYVTGREMEKRINKAYKRKK